MCYNFIALSKTKRIRLCKIELLISTFFKPVILTQGSGGGLEGLGLPSKMQNAWVWIYRLYQVNNNH